MIQIQDDKMNSVTHETFECWVCRCKYVDDEATNSRRVSYDNKGHTIKGVSVEGAEHDVCPECGNIFLDLYKRTPHCKRCYATKEVQDEVDTTKDKRDDTRGKS